MMKEYGGYIELDTYTGKMLHDDGIKLNCGRNALAYILKARNIKTLWYPRFMCDSCDGVLKESGVTVKYYSVGKNFRPSSVERADGEWLYLVNFYGQLDREYILSLGNDIIVDNAQAYFAEPLEGTDTLYTCRKFFGVSDGAVVYTDPSYEITETDESFERMHFLLGRYERSASEFYSEYVENNRIFHDQPVKRMSRLTENLLHGIDYQKVRDTRTANFTRLHELLGELNQLDLTVPEGAFMYPFYTENGDLIRKELQKSKIFIPTLWPAVFEKCSENDTEYQMARNILPVPVDQRYSAEDMEHIAESIKKYL